ncbi:MAG TPA: PAS domain S-box protein [Jatrophihabitantaceae bacterium]|jgi:PAS domain S-box-containing protein
MHAATEAEVLRLQTALRDLVALSAIPAAWVGTETTAVTAGLADELVALLQLDSAFVRLSSPGDGGAVEVTRGRAWNGFPQWLERHAGTADHDAGSATAADVGDGVAPCYGVAIPVGVNGDRGLVAAASSRSGFPTAIDRLLLSLAANQAATAFQNAHLIHERRRAADELRAARDELEVRVAERTAELLLANDALDRFFTLSPDLITVAGFDGHWKRVNPAVEAHLGYTEQEVVAHPYLEFVHPDDRERTEADVIRLVGGKTTRAFENRMLCKDGSYRWIDWTVAPVPEAGVLYAVGRDVTERRRAESELRRLVAEQAALRRVATLVAQGVQPGEIFSAVSEEVSRLFGSDAAVLRFEQDPLGITFVGISTDLAVPIGARWEFRDGMASAEAYRTGQPARVDSMDWSSGSGPVAATARRLGTVSTVVSPIVVEGGRWGAMSVSSTDQLLPLDTEERLDKFTGLVATAIANADGRSELAASRMRIVAASDEARRRIERDLHDGTQQRLVSLGLAIRLAEAYVPPGQSELRGELSRIAVGLAEAIEDLQEISRGIHPAILSDSGLGPALRTLARRSAIPVELDLATDTRLPEQIEVAAYFVASEALANAAKHAHASSIEVSLAPADGSVLLSIRDDGVGGADPARGSGLVGLTDRVDALGGSIRIDSRPAGGTHITAELPLEPEVAKSPEQPSVTD